MKQYNFDHIIDRTSTLSVKWNKRAIQSICNNEEALPFWVADMDFAPPSAVQETLSSFVEQQILGYPHHPHLRETFSEWVFVRHQWELSPKRVIITSGMLSSIALFIEQYSNVGDAVIVPMPAYKPFISILSNLQRTLIPWEIPYDQQQHTFSLDISSLRAIVHTHRPSILLFCSPHNPTGLVFTQEELLQIGIICKENDVLVISDEIHADLTYSHKVHIPFDVIAQQTGCTSITCMAPSKTFNIAGEHFGIAICSHQSLHLQVLRRLQQLYLGPDLLATAVAVASYTHGESWLSQLRTYLEDQASFIKQKLAQSTPSLHLVSPDCSFIALIDCSDIYSAVLCDAQLNSSLYDEKLSPEGGLLSRFFGQRASVAINDGTWFGKDYPKFVRFNFGTPRSMVEKGLERIVGAVETLTHSTEYP